MHLLVLGVDPAAGWAQRAPHLPIGSVLPVCQGMRWRGILKGSWLTAEEHVSPFEGLCTGNHVASYMYIYNIIISYHIYIYCRHIYYPSN